VIIDVPEIFYTVQYLGLKKPTTFRRLDLSPFSGIMGKGENLL
jgi:hypothetical protein